MTAVDERNSDRTWAALLTERDAAVRVAAARCRQPDDAEDCAHDALVRAATFPTLDLDRAGRLLMTTTARVTVDLHRREQARLRAELAAAARMFAQAGSPEDDVCDRAEAGWLARQVDDLPSTERSVLLARAAGETTRQTAQRLGLAEKTVENALGRARSKLTRRWRETLSGVLLPVALARKAFGAHAAVSSTAMALAAATGMTVVIVGQAAAPTSAAPVQSRPLTTASMPAASNPGSTAAAAVPSPPAKGPAAPLVAPTDVPTDATATSMNGSNWWWRPSDREDHQPQPPASNGDLRNVLPTPPTQRHHGQTDCRGWLLCPGGDAGGSAYR